MIRKTLSKAAYSFDENVRVWGIVSRSLPHKMCWLVNKAFDWDLSRQNDISVPYKNYSIVKDMAEPAEDEVILSFSLHSFKEEERFFEADLIANRHELSCYMPELKQFDYLLIVHGEFDYLPENMQAVLRGLPSVTIAAEVPLKKIKEQHRLHLYK